MATIDAQGAESVSVLVLDDSEPIVEILAQMLANLGVGKVLTAGDGERGLAVYDAEERPPDLLICDLSMPGMDGVEFLRHIAERGYEGGVILSSGADASVLKAAERLAQAHGLDLFGAIEKPVTEAVLAAVLRRCGEPTRSANGSRAGNTPTKGKAP